MIPRCPGRLPDTLISPIEQFAEEWLRSPLRPRVEPEIERAWDELVEEWIRASNLPLYIRKSAATRGVLVTHHSGRPLAACDNSTAVWAFTLALEGECPSLSEVAELVGEQAVPLAFTALRGRFAQFYAAGWKLAHIDDVGLGTRERLENVPMPTLEDHFRKLVLPANMFAIPKRWAGLGEVPEVIEAIRRSSRRRDAATPARRTVVQSPPQAEARPVSRNDGAQRVPSYRTTRLLFRADVIDRLTPDETFRIETPEGTFEMTKAEFSRTFSNVVASNTFRRTGVYSYHQTPAKAKRYLLADR